MPPRAPRVFVPFICRSCLQKRGPAQRSHFSTNFAPLQKSSESHTTPPSPPAPAFARLSARRLISLSGRDAAHFLQGLVTVNVTSKLQAQGGPGFYSAFLNASGRVLYDVFIYPVAGTRSWKELDTSTSEEEAGFLIEVDAKEVEALAGHLKRFKLRSKVKIRTVEEREWGVWALWGESLDTVNANGDSFSTSAGKEPSERIIGCVDKRAPGMGRRLILPHSEDVVGIASKGKESSHEQYDLRRMLSGVPEGQTEIVKESALPQESNIDYMGGIDFRKGCYVGQELTIRTHHTGVVRKRILPAQLYSITSTMPDALSYEPDSNVDMPPSGTNISRVDGKGRSAGRWIGGVGNVGLALCRLEVMTDTALTGESVQWKSDHEFKVAWGDDDAVKVRACVPPWHQERADAQRVQRR